ncbi:potassium/sodium hyperpolarization-activated cyclic nucleotide-gated channel protein [Parasponia andersonii]|uniref:Potassium/sodium hyperpolarization-activated cyclic nucleotide-gated channel protein n=1 Tax=Parasponia andersonii TaxID=3476 RepID=A0A2P5CKB3_PARAD|nr:potassium/sodium hyperpolarization-activated cyclic nucleotide-gated channel protein [Parasponia andersonii]
MASTSTLFHPLLHINPNHPNPLLPSQTSTNPSHFLLHLPPTRHHSPIKCTTTNSNSNPNSTPETPIFPLPTPTSETTIPAESFPIEKRRRSEIIRDRKPRTGLASPEPPNFEIGWKRTKEIKLEKPRGFVIADFLEKLEGLMGKEFGSTELLAKAGEIVAERAREEAEVLREGGEVEERLITELFRVLRLMEMDLAMVKAAVKEETLSERLQQAKARCRQAILVALSF